MRALQRGPGNRRGRPVGWRRRGGGRHGCLSFQVLQEYYINVTRKLKPGLSAEKARQDVRDLMAWRPESTDAHLLEAA